MPFINVHIGKPVSEEQKTEIMKKIAASMPLIPGKTADNTMIEISAGRDMYMGLEKQPLIFVDMRVNGPSPLESKDHFVQTLSKIFDETLGIPENKQYYNIAEMPGWGARGGYRDFQG